VERFSFMTPCKHGDYKDYAFACNRDVNDIA
jgi:hypothetical protein